MVLIIATSGVNFLYGIYANKYQSKNIELRSVDAKKSDYITEISQKYEVLKDIKIYKMKQWLTESFDIYRKKWSKYILKSENVKFGAVFMIGLVVAFSKWFNDIIVQVNDMIMLSVQIGHIRAFIDMDGEDTDNGKLPEVKDEPEIKFESISYKYPHSEQWIFRNFNLKISGGEKIALVGVNGSGKTTLMLLLMGLLEPNEGKILINGHDSREFNKFDYYKLFSPVFQDINIFPESIYANVAGSLKYDKNKAYNAMHESGMSRFINSLPQNGETFLVR